jgi:hypothetical protein
MSDDLSRRAMQRQYQQALPDDLDTEVDEPWPGRLPSSIRRYDRTLAPMRDREIITMHPNKPVPRSAIPPRRSAMQPAERRQTEDTTAPARRRRRGLFRAHPLLWLGVGMLLMFLLWVGLQDLGAWWSIHQDDVTYGRPRTSQYDVVVGHQDSPAHPTHLIALNLRGTIEIIELPGGDSAHAHIYQGPHLFGPAVDLVPVTLSFPDPSGDGHPDMDVHVQGQIIVYLNHNGKFVLQGSSQ